MEKNDQRDICVKLLLQIEENKTSPVFETAISTLQHYAATQGFEEEDFELLAGIIVKINTSATRMVSLTKCLVPKFKVSNKAFKKITSWFLSSVDKLPITVSISITQWIIGLWDHHLVDKKVVNIYYSVFFCVMLKKEKLEKHLARLVYVLSKPEDVTRKNVCRLLALRKTHSKPRTHIIVILSLFKAYKPELVPESINSVNVESVWKPLPEVLQEIFQNAKARVDLRYQQTSDIDEKCFNWNTFEVKTKRQKTTQVLLPSVGYFQIGSSIFKEKETTSIFDISSTEELGKSHLNIELPCNAVSLLANTAGHHLLTYADFHYQSRFSYNLYNTLIRAFILENEKFSEEEINKLLDMTIEFSRYMQQGILVVNRFLDEYLYFNTGEYQSKLLALMEWMTTVSISDLQDKVLIHVQNMFYESTIETKCEIIRMLKKLITNLFVAQGFEECDHTIPAPFLGQRPVDKLEDILPILTKFAQNIIISGLNIHNYNGILLVEALSFYNEICTLEMRSCLLCFTVAPAAVIYGGFLTKNCTILSKTCQLLLKYRSMTLKFEHRKLPSSLKKKIQNISIYAQSIIEALWFDESITERDKLYFFQNIPDNVIKYISYDDFKSLLNISNHYSILPYKCTLKKTGLNINTKQDAKCIAIYYYPFVNEFLDIFQS
nr:centromere protein I-like [Osmia lignaria]